MIAHSGYLPARPSIAGKNQACIQPIYIYIYIYIACVIFFLIFIYKNAAWCWWQIIIDVCYLKVFEVKIPPQKSITNYNIYFQGTFLCTQGQRTEVQKTLKAAEKERIQN